MMFVSSRRIVNLGSHDPFHHRVHFRYRVWPEGFPNQHTRFGPLALTTSLRPDSIPHLRQIPPPSRFKFLCEFFPGECVRPERSVFRVDAPSRSPGIPYYMLHHFQWRPAGISVSATRPIVKGLTFLSDKFGVNKICTKKRRSIQLAQEFFSSQWKNIYI